MATPASIQSGIVSAMLTNPLATHPWYQTLTITRHRRARHIRLRVRPPGQVVVTTPWRLPKRELEQFLCDNLRIISDMVARSESDYRLKGMGERPDLLDMQATGRTLMLRWAAEQAIELDNVTVALRDVDGDWMPALKALLRCEAEQYLTPQLEALAQTTGIEPTCIRYRLQRSRWGSCSARGTISLNLALLFFPPHLARHVMLHELCHLRHPNHSSRFWQTLAHHDPQWRAHDRALRAIHQQLPGWLQGALSGMS